MKKILLSLILVFALPIVLGIGGWGEGSWGEGGWGFGTPAPEPTPSLVTSGGGGGGGGGAYIPKGSNESITYSLNLIKGQVYDFNVDGEIHTLEVKKINVSGETATIIFKSVPIELLLKISIPKFVNYDNDNFYDLEVTLIKIYGSELVGIKIKNIHLGVPYTTSGISEPIKKEEVAEKPEVIESTPEAVEEEVYVEPKKEEVVEKPDYTLLKGFILILFGFVILYISLYFYYKSKKKENDDKKRDKREDKH